MSMGMENTPITSKKLGLGKPAGTNYTGRLATFGQAEKIEVSLTLVLHQTRIHAHWNPNGGGSTRPQELREGLLITEAWNRRRRQRSKTASPKKIRPYTFIELENAHGARTVSDLLIETVSRDPSPEQHGLGKNGLERQKTLSLLFIKLAFRCAS
jgi:hypothetical protein